MPELTKTRVVLDLVAEGRSNSGTETERYDDVVWFEQAHDPDESYTRSRRLVVDRETFNDVGQPTQITLTVDVGDLLKHAELQHEYEPTWCSACAHARASEGAADLLWQAREALRLTREYVGENTLPPTQGWSWYDATLAIDRFMGWDSRPGSASAAARVRDEIDAGIPDSETPHPDPNNFRGSGVDERALRRSTNAADWAREFCKMFSIFGDDGVVEDKEGLMIGWFANAMETMRDHLTSDTNESDRERPPEIEDVGDGA